MPGASAFKALTGLKWGPASFQIFEPLPDQLDPGCKKVLQDKGMLDTSLSDSHLYRRYMKFGKCTFPAAPQHSWCSMFADLALLEDCFTVGSALGCVHDMPFVFNVVDES